MIAALMALSMLSVSLADGDGDHLHGQRGNHDEGSRNVPVVPRPYFLIEDMDLGPINTARQKYRVPKPLFDCRGR